MTVKTVKTVSLVKSSEDAFFTLFTSSLVYKAFLSHKQHIHFTLIHLFTKNSLILSKNRLLSEQIQAKHREKRPL